MIMNTEQPASIKDNSGIIIPLLSFFLSFMLLCCLTLSLLSSIGHTSQQTASAVSLISPRES